MRGRSALSLLCVSPSSCQLPRLLTHASASENELDILITSKVPSGRFKHPLAPPLPQWNYVNSTALRMVDD